MSEGNKFSLINLDGASDIIIKLLDMIEKAVGWSVIQFTTPKGAKADFEEGLAVYKESIMNDDSLSGILKSAKISAARKELKQYINQGKIISYASENIKDDAKMDVDDDWLMYFFEHAKNITNEDVQKIWGKILAEKCNDNNSVTRKLINILSMLDEESAVVFGELCSITIDPIKLNLADILYNNTTSRFTPTNMPLVIDVPCYLEFLDDLSKDDIYISNPNIIKNYINIIMKTKQFAVLEEIGLIETCKGNECFKYKNEDTFSILFSNKEIAIMCPKRIRAGCTEINFGYIKFTVMGNALYEILNTEPFQNFELFLQSYFEYQGYVVDLEE